MAIYFMGNNIIIVIVIPLDQLAWEDYSFMLDYYQPEDNCNYSINSSNLDNLIKAIAIHVKDTFRWYFYCYFLFI